MEDNYTSIGRHVFTAKPPIGNLRSVEDVHYISDLTSHQVNNRLTCVRGLPSREVRLSCYPKILVVADASGIASCTILPEVHSWPARHLLVPCIKTLDVRASTGLSSRGSGVGFFIGRGATR